MKKANPLMTGLSQFDRKSEISAPAQPPLAQSKTALSDGKTPASRIGAVQIAAYFPAEVRAQLKIVAAEQRRDMQDVIAEALNLIFVRYGKAEIAPRK